MAIFSRPDRRAFAIDAHRRIVIAAIVIVSLGYLVMFAMVFDYSRWISNWAVCLFLILHAVKTLPASRGRAADIGGRPEDDDLRLDRHADPARRDRAAVLKLDPRPPHPDIQRALAAMADMGFLEPDHQRAEFRQAQPLRHLAAQHAALGFARRPCPCR